jgi:hypothetical protein
MSCRWRAVEMDNDLDLSPFFRSHWLFTADNVTGVDAPTDFIHHDREAANAALISIALLHSFLRNLLCNFLLSHGFLLSFL